MSERTILAEIGNIVGSPTMQYDREFEREELLVRMGKIAKLVTSALAEPEKPMYGVGVSVLLTNTFGQLLLAKRRNNSGAGLLSTPGGRIEYNESPEEAGHREFYEETGALLAPMHMLGLRKHNRFNDHYFMFLIYRRAPELATCFIGH